MTDKICISKQKIISDVNSLSNLQQIDILNIIHKYDVKFSENNNGIFVDLNIVPDDFILEIEKYTSFCKESNDLLSGMVNNDKKKVLVPPEPIENESKNMNIDNLMSKIIDKDDNQEEKEDYEKSYLTIKGNGVNGYSSSSSSDMFFSDQDNESDND